MKKIVITEDIEHEIVSDILAEAFYPDHKLVIEIKDFLDDNFSKKEMDDVDANGYPTKSHSVALLSNNGQELKLMQLDELLSMLDDKFHDKFDDDKYRKKFLKQVIIDWWNKKIDRNGVLSVNSIK